jgi:hypothetical protein
MVFRVVWLTLCLLSMGSSLQAHLIEFYADWAWHTKGTKLFTPPPGQKQEEWSVLSKIQAGMKERGWEIVSWDWDFYRPLLLKGDLKAWRSWKRAMPDNPGDLWVFWNMGGMLKDFDLSRESSEKLVLFMWEPPTVQASLYKPEVQALFGKIFTWDDDLVDGKKFFKFNYPVLKKRIDQIPSFDKKKFCVMINTHLKDKHPCSLYGEREKAARFFENKQGEFDLYGRFWDPQEFKNWKGTVKSKPGTLKQYRFCICYENMRDVKGYITEKIFDCFMAGCIPVYWGASNVTDYIPPECFIDRRQFNSTEELYLFMKKMDQKVYERYLYSAEKFLKSPEAQLFSPDAFVKIFLDELVPSSGR